MYYYDENGKPIPPSPVPVPPRPNYRPHVDKYVSAEMQQEQRTVIFLLLPVLCLVAVFSTVFLSHVPDWSRRGCNLPSSIYLSITRGEPGIFDYCPAKK